MLPTTSRRRPRSVARYCALVAVPLLVGWLAACSSVAGDPNPSEKPAVQEQTVQDWQVSFAACMRDEGIADFPDPEPDGSVKAGGQLDDEDAAAQQVAGEACLDKLGEPPAGPDGKKSEEKIREGGLKVAECFRDNGYDMDDPEGNGLMLPDAPEDITEKCLSAGGVGPAK